MTRCLRALRFGALFFFAWDCRESNDNVVQKVIIQGISEKNIKNHTQNLELTVVKFFGMVYNFKSYV